MSKPAVNEEYNDLAFQYAPVANQAALPVAQALSLTVEDAWGIIDPQSTGYDAEACRVIWAVVDEDNANKIMNATRVWARSNKGREFIQDDTEAFCIKARDNAGNIVMLSSSEGPSEDWDHVFLAKLGEVGLEFDAVQRKDPATPKPRGFKP